MENILFKTNEELLTITQNLVGNHDKLKQEIAILYELLLQVESDYVEVMTELKNRDYNG